MLKRGPQWVQLVKGYRKRRSAGSKSSCRQSGHVARSGVAMVEGMPVWMDSRILKSVSPRASSHSVEHSWMELSGGGALVSRSENCSIDSGRPSISMTTPWGELRVYPERASSVARRCTNGRKPTPCTVPVRRSRRRAQAGWRVGMAVFMRQGGAGPGRQLQPMEACPLASGELCRGCQL